MMLATEPFDRFRKERPIEPRPENRAIAGSWRGLYGSDRNPSIVCGRFPNSLLPPKNARIVRQLTKLFQKWLLSVASTQTEALMARICAISGQSSVLERNITT